jgi:hypothetical protein
MINNVAIPSRVSPAYAPEGKSLFSVVLLGTPELDDAVLVGRVRQELIEWFGAEARGWHHLATYHIRHALPDQCPPTENPTRSNPMIRPGVFACGERGGLPGIQWAMLSGRRAAEGVMEYLSR